jgi:hypothetical protein
MTPTTPGTDTPAPSPAERTPLARLQQWSERTHGRGPIGVGLLLIAHLTAIFAILAFYSWFRKTYFQQPADLAFANALDIIDLQRRLGIAVTDVEIPMQQWVIARPELVDFFNAYYRQFKPALYLCAALCFLLAPVAFRRILIAFLAATLLAFPWYALYPLAPPRLMTEFGYDFVDTLAVYGGVQSSSAGAGGANQFAAMPSMHIGWTTFAAFWIAAAIPWWRVGAIVGATHLLLIGVTVVVTGNHYTLDIVGGLAVAGVAVLVARSLPDQWSFSRASAMTPAPRQERTAAPPLEELDR